MSQNNVSHYENMVVQEAEVIERRPTLVQSVDRALDILECLSSAPDGLPLVGLAHATEINVSTCHHLLATMARRGYIMQDPISRYYLLGNEVLHLQMCRGANLNLLTEARPVLQALNRSTGEAVHLAVMQARELATLVKLESLHAVRVDSGLVGKSNAAHATATGKSILAFLGSDIVNAIIREKGLRAFTERTITDLAALEQELALVRERGYAIDDEEFQPGVYCVGAPIRNYTGEVVASISCSLPVSRLGQQEIVEQTLAAAMRLSDRLAYQEA